MVVTTSNCKAELKADDVILVKAVPLKSIDHDCRLFDCLKVREAEMHLEAVFCLTWHQPELLEAWIWSEEVRNLTLCCIMRQSFHIDRLRGVLGVLHDLWKHLG